MKDDKIYNLDGLQLACRYMSQDNEDSIDKDYYRSSLNLILQPFKFLPCLKAKHSAEEYRICFFDSISNTTDSIVYGKFDDTDAHQNNELIQITDNVFELYFIICVSNYLFDHLNCYIILF
ncbi:MAG: hypothetical protein MHMPM18_004554 [Marteilia pararefringens]